MKVSIVIPCYNEKDMIEKIVEAVFNAPLKSREIIVVDDCSKDGTQTLLWERLSSVGRSDHLREYCVWIKRPAQLVQYRVRVVLVGKSEPRDLLFCQLKLGELGRCAFNSDVQLFQGVFDTARKT
jgi:cellulose synthase/poly-beta-1,6-N-acetylglucosamine synthase-like glycosyltransferase